MNEVRQWLTVAEAAERTGHAEVFLRQAAQRGAFRAEKSSGTWLVYWPSVQEWLETRAFGPRDKDGEESEA